MNRALIPLGLFGLVVVLLALGIVHAPEKGVVISPLVGKPAPEFHLPTLGDPSQVVSSQDLKGKWYLLNVWGTWCVTCAEEHSMLLTVARSGAVPVIGMDWRDEAEAAQKWLTERGNPYEKVMVDPDGRQAVNWGVTMAPESFLVNPEGIIVYKCSGAITPQVWEKEILPRVKGTGGDRASG